MLEQRNKAPFAVRVQSFVTVLGLGFFLLACAATANGQVTRKQIIEYAEQCKAQDQRLNLIGRFGTDFSNLDLNGIDFRGMDSVDARTILVDADFSNSNLQDAQFGRAVLDGANFGGADLSRASFFRASLVECDFAGANLTDTVFYYADFSNAHLPGIDLSRCVITYSSFSGADLQSATLSGAVNLYWWSDFTRANLENAQLTGLQLNGARFRHANLKSANLTNTQLKQADFFDADLTGANFENANVESAIFAGARGLNDATRKQLEDQAARWKFDLENKINELLSASYIPAYGLLLGCLGWLAFRQNKPARRGRLSQLAVAVNCSALLPTLAVIWLHNSGASTTVQFNANSDAAMSAWSTWVGIWPLFLLLALACTVVAAILFLVFVFDRLKNRSMRNHWLHLVHYLLTIAHCLFSLQLIGANFPSA